MFRRRKESEIATRFLERLIEDIKSELRRIREEITRRQEEQGLLNLFLIIGMASPFIQSLPDESRQLILQALLRRVGLNIELPAPQPRPVSAVRVARRARRCNLCGREYWNERAGELTSPEEAFEIHLDTCPFINLLVRKVRERLRE